MVFGVFPGLFGFVPKKLLGFFIGDEGGEFEIAVEIVLGGSGLLTGFGEDEIRKTGFDGAAKEVF